MYRDRIARRKGLFACIFNRVRRDEISWCAMLLDIGRAPAHNANNANATSICPLTPARPSTCPYPYDPITSTFHHVAISYTYVLHHSRRLALICLDDSRAAVPLSALNLVVHFDYVLARCAYYSSCVKHHACDGVVVRVCVIYGACPEVPYLEERVSHQNMTRTEYGFVRTLMLLSKLPVTR